MSKDADNRRFIDITTFTGLNTLDEPQNIDISESPEMVNMNITKNGSIISRFGYEEVCTLPGSGGVHGIQPVYFQIETLDEDRLAIFHGGKLYYITNTNSAPIEVGNYGADKDSMGSTVFMDNLIFGNSASGNRPKRWDGTTLTDLNISAPNASIWTVFQSKLIASGTVDNPSSVFYSETDTIDTDLGTSTFSVRNGDGTIITDISPNNDVCQIFKENSIHAANITLDEVNAYVIFQQIPVESANGGAYGRNTVQPILGYNYYLSKYGVDTYGSTGEKLNGNLPLPLSYKISPTIDGINFASGRTFTSAMFDSKYILGVPLGASTSNNTALVYDERVKRRFGADNWVPWEIPTLGQLAIFRDGNKRDQLYFGSNTEPVVYRFNTTFSDNGVGYTRSWRSKTFRFGERTVWDYIDVEGAKPRGVDINIFMTVDGAEEELDSITDDNFISQGSGFGYLGDSYYGDVYTGASFSTTEAIPLYRFKKRIAVPPSLSEGYEMNFKLTNNVNGGGWKLTRAKLSYIIDPDDPSYKYTN